MTTGKQRRLSVPHWRWCDSPNSAQLGAIKGLLPVDKTSRNIVCRQFNEKEAQVLRGVYMVNSEGLKTEPCKHRIRRYDMIKRLIDFHFKTETAK